MVRHLVKSMYVHAEAQCHSYKKILPALQKDDHHALHKLIRLVRVDRYVIIFFFRSAPSVTCLEGILIKLYEGLNYTSLYVYTNIICMFDRYSLLPQEGHCPCQRADVRTVTSRLMVAMTTRASSIRSSVNVDTGVVSLELLLIPICEEWLSGAAMYL